MKYILRRPLVFLVITFLFFLSTSLLFGQEAATAVGNIYDGPWVSGDPNIADHTITATSRYATITYRITNTGAFNTYLDEF